MCGCAGTVGSLCDLLRVGAGGNHLHQPHCGRHGHPAHCQCCGLPDGGASGICILRVKPPHCLEPILLAYARPVGSRAGFAQGCLRVQTDCQSWSNWISITMPSLNSPSVGYQRCTHEVFRYCVQPTKTHLHSMKETPFRLVFVLHCGHCYPCSSNRSLV